ncbi:MAG: hypothetical protein COW00_02730 [Bdellovibrio sp. CG12_big_fil_rev_8_21_14_0_65_39_13]|nr:MAG: hypothetical protein COW78_03995 [Bdellovibrio sp. CG22_combo_CG10-13_8_21_14_all_39_27]PIQ61973.1 MAG: hypothetical protein COW00_02730 [Bdellovibrio sp. CG12_big_fil_rev_8_21_14_0_65_39_13]PIR32609.1 MAG: hypothetical protein COV37_19280 [Bdellovibrio sp. CG11_big_fil_rev_8_21_14_0_20_39_38]
MKKHVLIATGLAVLSTSAFATKARMTSLGQSSTYGSQYLQDTRNIFRNASEVNAMKNYVVTEWGPNTTAEGGFFREAGSFSYGLYMGSEINTFNTERTTAAQLGHTFTNTFLKHDNSLDLFFAGDAGVEWGARVHYANGKDEQTVATVAHKHSALGLGLGMGMGDIKAYFNMTLNDKSEGADATGDKFEAKDMLAGASYNWMGYVFSAEYAANGYEVTPTGIAKGEVKNTDLTIAVGKTKEISATSRMNWDVNYNTGDAKTKNVAGAAETKTKHTNLPVTIGFETDATSWLVLRGSVSQKVLFNETKDNNGKKKTNADTTSVIGGATLNFGKLKVDGSLEGSNAAGGKLNASTLLANVAVHYWF